MLNFEWLFMLGFLPVPILAYYLLPNAKNTEQSALKVPFLEDFESSFGQTTAVNHKRNLWLPILAWCFLVLAGMRPQWLGEPIELGVNGRDLILAVDLSGSMAQEDFELNGQMANRLTAVKSVAGDFINRRIGDRLGLILFGTNAYLQTPLTFDRKTVAILLNESFLKLAGESTAIGDAIGLAVKRLKNQKAQSRALILLTDGANTAGVIEPLKAAELARDLGLKIYTVGIGAKQMRVNNFFGTQIVNPSRDLDEKMLNEIAITTGGQYFRATDTESLTEIYQILDELEPIEKDRKYFHPVTEWYPYPLGIALLFGFLISFLRARN